MSEFRVLEPLVNLTQLDEINLEENPIHLLKDYLKIAAVTVDGKFDVHSDLVVVLPRTRSSGDLLPAMSFYEESALISSFYSNSEIPPANDRRVFTNQEAPEQPRNHDVLNIRTEILETFTYYFKHGAAAERFVANEILFREVHQQAKSSSQWRSTLGGNAPLMASRFALEGAQKLLGSHMSADLKKSLPEGVTLGGPEVEEDNYHMQLEYAAGKKFIPYQAPRANRFVIHNDHVNPRFRSVEGFNEKPSLAHVDLELDVSDAGHWVNEIR